MSPDSTERLGKDAKEKLDEKLKRPCHSSCLPPQTASLFCALPTAMGCHQSKLPSLVSILSLRNQENQPSLGDLIHRSFDSAITLFWDVKGGLLKSICQGIIFLPLAVGIPVVSPMLNNNYQRIPLEPCAGGVCLSLLLLRAAKPLKTAHVFFHANIPYNFH